MGFLFYSAYFNQIQTNQIDNLVIDLRENGGGNPDYVKEVLQYLFAKPFEQTIECRIVKAASKEKLSERTRKKMVSAVWHRHIQT